MKDKEIVLVIGYCIINIPKFSDLKHESFYCISQF